MPQGEPGVSCAVQSPIRTPTGTDTSRRMFVRTRMSPSRARGAPVNGFRNDDQQHRGAETE